MHSGKKGNYSGKSSMHCTLKGNHQFRTLKCVYSSLWARLHMMCVCVYKPSVAPEEAACGLTCCHILSTGSSSESALYYVFFNVTFCSSLLCLSCMASFSRVCGYCWCIVVIIVLSLVGVGSCPYSTEAVSSLEVHVMLSTCCIK